MIKIPEGIKVVSDAVAEKCDMVVCMRIGEGNAFRFDDNQFGRCADCGAAIYFRPYNPKKPVKVCIACAMIRAGIPAEDRQRMADELRRARQGDGGGDG